MPDFTIVDLSLNMNNIVGNLFVYLLMSLCMIRCRVDASGQRLKQCYPQFDNHTLCHGPRILNSVKSFSGLLRSSRTGYSIYQSNIWIILLNTKCHADLEKLLCSIYAPICLKGHHFTRILPCRELCFSVREKCLPRMKIYGFEWPAMVNCSKLPSDKDSSCIQLTDRPENKLLNSQIKRQREDRSLNQTILSDEEERKKQKNCQICNRKVALDILAKKFCEHSLVVKAKISNIFQKPKGAISIRLLAKSNIMFSSHPIKISLTNLITELQCKCPILQNAKSVNRGKWLLIGDIENGQFIVKFLTKWQRKRKKFRILFRLLKEKPKRFCKNQKNLMKSVDKQARLNEFENDYKKPAKQKSGPVEYSDYGYLYNKNNYE